MRIYIFNASEGSEYISVVLSENGRSFRLHWKIFQFYHWTTITIDKDEKYFTSAILSSDKHQLVVMVKCETNESLQQELVISQLPFIFFEEDDEEDEEVMELTQKAVCRQANEHLALCTKYDVGPKICFTQNVRSSRTRSKSKCKHCNFC